MGDVARARSLDRDSPDLRDPATDEEVERVVAQLHDLCRAATMDFALSVGKLIISNFFSGNLASWRDRDPKKNASLRRLAAHPDLPMSPAVLYRSIAIYELCERLGIRSWKHVSTTHIRLVLPLEPAEQARLLRLCEAHAWPVRRLDEEVAAISRESPEL